MGADVVSRKSVFAKLGKEPPGQVDADPQSTEFRKEMLVSRGPIAFECAPS